MIPAAKREKFLSTSYKDRHIGLWLTLSASYDHQKAVMGVLIHDCGGDDDDDDAGLEEALAEASAREDSPGLLRVLRGFQ